MGGLARLNSGHRLYGGSMPVDLMKHCPSEQGSYFIPGPAELAEFHVVVATCQVAGMLLTAGLPAGNSLSPMSQRFLLPCAISCTMLAGDTHSLKVRQTAGVLTSLLAVAHF